MTTYFTSDPHFGHRKVAEIRGFDSPEEHDAALAANWRAVVRPGDKVWVLGDLAMSSPRTPWPSWPTCPARST